MIRRTTASWTVVVLVMLVAGVMLVVAGGMAPAPGPAAAADLDSERAGSPPTAAAALAEIRVPEGMRVTLFAAEPVIRNPIAATVDAAGRLWVAENHTYAEPPIRQDERLRDRVTILDDTDGDGRADRHRIALDGLVGLTGIAVGQGGAWLMCPPRLLFVPERLLAETASPQAAAAGAVTVLDGFEIPKGNHHTVANGLSWGPDGWLYGRCGASSPGEVGLPGAAADDRVPIRGGIWRFHPARRVFEPLVHGTTNPWGHDWNADGECFFVNTVNGHLWQMIPGAHFARPHSIDPNPHVYDLIDQHADHYHFDTSRSWTESRDGRAAAHGGGHAHSGAWIVPDGPAWPHRLHGRLLTLNFHGRRINVDRLDPEGSGFVGRHDPDLAFFGDPWFRGIDLVPLAADRVAILDWSDTGECHEHTGVHRSSGRIYLLASAGGTTPPPESRGRDMAAWPDNDLVAAIWGEEWRARLARQVLADRHLRGDDLSAVRRTLSDRLATGSTRLLRLRALWALWATGGLPEPDLLALCAADDGALRVWAVRLLSDAWPLDTVMSRRPRADVMPAPQVLATLESLAANDPAAPVRLAVASALQRLPAACRSRIAARLAAHREDVDDHNLPSLVWYGLIPAATADPRGVVEVWRTAAWPSLRRSIAHRLADGDDDRGGGHAGLDLLLAAAADADAAARRDLIDGLTDAWRGRRQLARPVGWDLLHEAVCRDGDAASISQLLALAARCGDARAAAELEGIVRAAKPSAVERAGLAGPVVADRRVAALAALIEARSVGYQSLCRSRLATPGFAAVAAGGLLIDGDIADARRLLDAIPGLDSAEVAAVIAVLASRPTWAAVLLDGIEAGMPSRDALGPLAARQIAGLGDVTLAERLARVWGQVRSGRAETTEQIAAWRTKLTPATLAAADASAGRVVWNRQCAACHRLHGEGGTLGPDLTGAGRHDLDYLLQNILDPAAVVTNDYRLRQVLLADGRVFAGIVVKRTPTAVSLRTPTDTFVLATADIDEVQDLGSSIMPDGLLDRLRDDEVQDLIAYLMSPGQRPLPAQTK